MSNSIDPKQTKANQKNQLKELAIRLGVLQREAKVLGIPTLVMIEGLDASEKGLLLNQVLLEIDARSDSFGNGHLPINPPFPRAQHGMRPNGYGTHVHL